ncbi:DNA-binding response regulator [Cupriavidus sp. USMAHM13]|uniref:DNA-binding response regulator n=1 Tax=Cupriavidus malaysiensis TaxID=367825 RepID=A0ABN4TSM5_9BURK|nr:MULTISPECIES: response regulator transcription factor [Cupriavidus]AOZ01610.1 DNA-binding response regulator [Cupriavidus sp. USMAHM13]AOZ08660.1 DNA-binding response regulator [Cupriavidus malaysiensis]
MTNTAPNADDSLLPAPMLIVEDDLLMQARLRDLLMVLGYTPEALLFAGSIAQAKALLADQPIAMALVDVGLPDGNGVDLIRVLHQRDATLPILVISTWNTEQVVVTALQAGATGYLLKERDDAEISLSIRSALRGGAPIDPFVAKRILELIGTGGTLLANQAPTASREGGASPLSGREIEILSLVSKGLTNREIADVLSLSKLTVGCHIRNIYKKLAVNSRTQAIFEARSNGWLP